MEPKSQVSKELTLYPETVTSLEDLLDLELINCGVHDNLLTASDNELLKSADD
jgi:hypothetical protein